MKIALLGYGKMGKIIEKIATDRKHEIVLKIDKDNLEELTAENLQLADVAMSSLHHRPYSIISANVLRRVFLL
jgi:prephenate dehydrogenase